MKKILFLLLMIIVFASLFVFRVPLIQKLSPSVAEHYGFDISRVEFSQIDINKIVVPMLAMQYEDGTMRLNIEIHNFVADIDTFKAEVTGVSSSYVYIDVENIEGGDGSASSEEGVKDVVSLLPIFGINIERLDVRYRANGEELLHFEGEFSHAKNAILKGTLNSWNKFDFAVELSVDESDFIVDVSQFPNGESVIAFTGDYQVEDDWLDVELKGDLSLSTMNRFLHEMGVDEYVQEDTSTIKAKFELDLTRSTKNIMQSFAANIEVDSGLSISSEYLGVKQAQVDVSASCHVERADTIDCLFKDPQRVVMELYDSPGWLAEYFSGIGNEYVVEVNPHDQLNVKFSLREVLSADIKGDASIDIHDKSSRLKFKGVVSEFGINGTEQDWQLHADYKINFEALDVITPVEISRLLASGRGKVDADEEKMSLYVDKNFVANALNVNYQGYRTKKIQLKQLSDAQIIYRYGDENVNADNMKFSLSSNQLRKNDIEFEFAPIQFHVENFGYVKSKQKLLAGLDMDNMLFKQRGIPVSAYGLNAKVELKDNQLSIDGNVALGEQKHPVIFSVSHDLLMGVGLGDVSSKAIALANNEIISRQISDSGFPLQLKGGKLDVDIDAIWDVNHATSEVIVKLLADRVMGDYAQNQFTDLNTALEFVGQKGWKLKQPSNIDIAEFNVGVPLKNVSMSLQRMEYGVQEQPLIKLSDLSAGALDGSIYSEQIEIDLNRSENMFSIFLSSLSLEKLIALNQTEDLLASGTLNGELPMRIDNGVLLIDSGWLRASEEGGYIKYGRIGEVLVGNENLKLVGELLEDFQYNEMSAQIDLVSGGGLTLATKLHGRSPNAELNKQVNLNFNIDFNLWKFLESARLLTRIDQDVSEQILSNQK